MAPLLTPYNAPEYKKTTLLAKIFWGSMPPDPLAPHDSRRGSGVGVPPILSPLIVQIFCTPPPLQQFLDTRLELTRCHENKIPHHERACIL